MDFVLKLNHCSNFLFVSVMVLLPALTVSQDFACSRATYYGSPNCLGNPTGACGYGDYGTTMNDGNVAAVSRLYRGGTGCGACYQVRCKAPMCKDDGVQVVVTDHGAGDDADFILSPRAYTRMARSGAEEQLLGCGVVDIEYRRVPCQYDGSNLFLKIHEKSKYPHYLALVPFYQAGMSDIVAMEIWQDDCKEWRPMRKPFGAAWDMENPPRGDLTIRLQVCSSAGGDARWVQLPRVIPDCWEEGTFHDTGIQLY